MIELFQVEIADESHVQHAESISIAMLESAKARGTGIAKRSPDYLREKMLQDKAIIAIASESHTWVGFCYIEAWGHGRYVANSGLIVLPQFREMGLARRIKEKAFSHSRAKYPEAKLFGLTTSDIVMNINSDLGYRPVTFKQLTNDSQFWDGCRSCVNHRILVEKEFKNCLCTAMLFEPDRLAVSRREGAFKILENPVPQVDCISIQ
jgi:hypothetical protein